MLVSGAVKPSLVYRALTFAGAIPFLACGVLPWFGVDTLGPLGATLNVLLIYGLAILSFLCGTQWAAELARPGASGLPLFIISNLIVVVAWLAVLAVPVAIALSLQFVGFVVVLGIDGRLHVRGVISDDYWRLRIQITAIVLAAVLLGILAAWRG